MEIIPNTPIKVKLESICRDHASITELLKLKGNLLDIVYANDEERILFDLCKAGYYWDDKYIYDDNVKVCKLNHVSQQVIFNPDYNPDQVIMNICEGWECYWKGELWNTQQD